ncbi:MAG: UDP-3-O-(3-hydroxymyristoyl)glucosamine N-acyltransferase, partial [Vicingaceae bacterium]
MEFSANQISELLQGKIEGNGETSVSALSKIEEGKSGSLSFLANPKYTEYI